MLCSFYPSSSASSAGNGQEILRNFLFIVCKLLWPGNFRITILCGNHVHVHSRFLRRHFLRIPHADSIHRKNQFWQIEKLCHFFGLVSYTSYEYSPETHSLTGYKCPGRCQCRVGYCDGIKLCVVKNIFIRYIQHHIQAMKISAEKQHKACLFHPFLTSCKFSQSLSLFFVFNFYYGVGLQIA